MNTEEDSFESRQKHEIAALQAIYLEDFLMVNSNDNENESSNHVEFILNLKPLQGSTKYNEVYAAIKLHFRLSKTYPESSPSIQLEDGCGMSLKDIENLKKELEILCDRGRGEEIGLVLALHVQGFLAEKNKKPRFQSFHEEMIVAHQIEKERNALEKKSRMVEENNQQLMAFEEEIKQKQPAFLLDLMKNKNKDNNIESLPQILPKNDHLEEAAEVHVACIHTKPLQIDFGNKYAEHIYQCGPCLGLCQPNRHVFSAVETKLKEFAVITQFRVPCLSNPDSCSKQISAIEHEFRQLLKIRHSNLVSYSAFKWEVIQGFLQIYVVEEFVSGMTLNFYVQRNFRVDVDILRHLTDGVIQALNVLHKSNFVHKNIRPSSIFIDTSSQIRLTDYCLEPKINEIFSITDERPSLTTYPSPPGRGGKRGDIHRLGILIWTLFQGNIVHEWDHLKLPSSMPLSLQDLVSKCLDLDSRNRHVTVEELVNHSFIKTPIRGSIKERANDNDEENSDFQSSPLPSLALTTSAVSGSFPSRLLCEFETMQFLGSGGFGDVLKVRNNLDGNIYAIKRILLDRKSRQLNKKITREVKLLSRLNHENIVRYYNSWIETAQLNEPSSRSEVTPANEVSDSPALDSPAHSESLWFDRPHDSDSSGGIEFEEDSDAAETSSSLETSIEDTVDSPSVSQHPTSLQFMYIQMEYCEKSTLRTAIDSDLFCDKIRIWRLFREIVEGLSYIHQQGVIHRDLKPVNIFLDCDDHVKIGDFGLATAKMTNQSGTPNDFVDGAHRVPHSEKSSEVASGSEHFIGTALYVAPELRTCGKPVYNERVDIYSLGIIFFEMCHPPLSTGMERIKVLSSIRQPNFMLPDGLTAHEAEVIVWLLNHNPALRPSSTEILQSPYLPPPQLEDAELQEMVRHTLSNTNSKAYKYLVASCLQQKMSKLEEIIYDIEMINSAGFHQSAMISQMINDVFRKHCQRRGAIPLDTPTLTPKVSDGIKQHPSSVQLMTQAGGVVTLPMDLQTPFARYIGRSKITWLKRYSISKTYAEEKGSRTIHPKCSSELAFDIVTPSPASVLSDAEVMTTISDILHDPRLRINRPLSLQIGHRLLLEAILIHCGIAEDKRKDLCHILKVCSKSENHIRSRASKLALSAQSVEMLLPFLEMEGSAAKMKASLVHLLNAKEESASLVARALHEIDVIMAHAEDMGFKLEFTVAIDLAIQHYNIYSGIIFRFIGRPKSRKNMLIEVLATGGRYDDLVASFRNQSSIKFINRISHGQPTIKMENDVVSPPCAIGAVIHLDKLISVVKESCSKEESMVASVVICTVGHRPLTKEKAWLIRDLWDSGITATTMDHLQSIEELEAWCRERNVPHIVQLKDSEAGYCRLRTLEKDRYTERKMAKAELIETLINSLKPENCDSSFRCSRQNVTNRNNSMSESTGSSVALGSSGVLEPVIHFTLEDKLVQVSRRYKTQISKHLQSTLQNFTNRAQIEVIVIEATSDVIQSLLVALYVDPSDSKAVKKAKEIVAEKHKRQRKYLERIYDHLFHLKFEKSVTVLIIYGLHDKSHGLSM